MSKGSCVIRSNSLKHEDLKEQYPVTAHAPNFDFWTGCPEIKTCEESKRTLKNPFASRLANLGRRCGPEGNLVTVLLSFEEKTDDARACAQSGHCPFKSSELKTVSLSRIAHENFVNYDDATIYHIDKNPDIS